LRYPNGFAVRLPNFKPAAAKPENAKEAALAH
jgi:hypothetical protein